MIPPVLLANFPYLLEGLWVTLATAALVMLGGMALGLAAGIVRATRVPVLRQLVAVYIELVRGTPLLVILFLTYFALPALLGIRIAAWPAAIIGFILFIGAYIAEDIATGIAAVPAGLHEAARASGMSGRQTLLTITLPLALRRMLPALFNQFVRLLKFTSVASVIGVTELTGTAIEINARDFHPVELLGALAAAYLVMTLALSQFGRWLARRTAIM